MKAKLPTIRELAEIVRHVAKQVPRIGDPASLLTLARVLAAAERAGL